MLKAFNTALQLNPDKSYIAAYQTPVGDSPVPYRRITYKMPCCGLFHANAPVHAQRSRKGFHNINYYKSII